MSLAVFDISKYIENGEVVEPVYELKSGNQRYTFSRALIQSLPTLPSSRLEEFQCLIKPRSQKARDLIHAEIHM